jgi:hypothetical protein
MGVRYLTTINGYDCDRIRVFHRAAPFQPFDIHLADGRSIPVDHPELMAIYQSGRTVAVIVEDVLEVIDLLLVTSLKHRSNGRTPRTRRRRQRVGSRGKSASS